MGRLRRRLLGLAALLAARPLRRPAPERIVPEGTRNPRAETAVLVLLGLTALSAVAVPVIYAVDALPAQTQLLGLAFGLTFLSGGAAMIVAGKHLVVTEELEGEYHEESPQEQDAVVQILEESTDRLTRKRLLAFGCAGAGCALGIALLTPALSMGPVLDIDQFYRTPWRRGRRLVGESGQPLRAADIEQATFYTAFPEGVPREQIAAPLVLVRLDPGSLRLPPELRGFDADGILAFSKICTHAACAISLYRAPLFEPADPRPALICPCHYSTFDPARGGKVLFGPASRPLPMLPLAIDRAGYLQAAGNFSAPPGPSWWGVRLREPET